METVISDQAQIVATKDQSSCPLGDDTVILDLKAGLYFSLNNVGAMIWRLIQQPKSRQGGPRSHPADLRRRAGGVRPRSSRAAP